ncbi:MAG: NAD(+) synthase [Lactobacillaceae bacterium]|jgi:NAD+ synthase/NAD+ synthase (glutamine-hydrolysing)|nr:NAD(+) synthase [Lactobacillaceae bacterium]
MQKIWLKLQNGLIDYCGKKGFNKVALGLSGGMDSALVAALAADAVGPQNVYAFMMSTKYTSRLSKDLARQLSLILGINYEEFDIQKSVDEELALLNGYFPDGLNSVAEQNIQSRVRGNLLMGVSNNAGHLVLACGNRSEVSVGYCTLYGDTAGGLMPIGNIYKTEVFKLAKWRNGGGIVIPEEIINRVPSAELKYEQKDEDSLPPYDVLDPILIAYLDEKKIRDEIIAAGYPEDVVDFIIGLNAKAQFKLKQLPEMLPR